MVYVLSNLILVKINLGKVKKNIVPQILVNLHICLYFNELINLLAVCTFTDSKTLKIQNKIV